MQLWGINISGFPGQFIYGLRAHLPAIHFIRRHRIWEGSLSYGWMTRILLAGGIIVALKFISILADWIGLTGDNGASVFSAGLGTAFQSFWEEGRSLLFSGGLKYLVLILMEVFIFHFTRRALEIVNHTSFDRSFEAFLRAEVRMIKVVIFSFVMETIIGALAGVALGILSLHLLKEPVNFLVQCYFFGFSVVDNYNELTNKTIRESAEHTKQYAGLAVSIGLVMYGLLLIPGLGAFLASGIGAVTATLSMNHLEEERQLAEPAWAGTGKNSTS